MGWPAVDGVGQHGMVDEVPFAGGDATALQEEFQETPTVIASNRGRC